MIDYLTGINDWRVKVPAKLGKALNKYFSKWEYAADGCKLREGSHVGSAAPLCLIIEESSMYHYMQGEYGWEAHTDWHNAFNGTGWHPEMQNSCVICFYKD